jgi:ribosomal subunit interface protein
MAFPHINVKGTQFTITTELHDQLDEKLGQLEKLLPEGETDIICDVELELVTRHHQSGRIYRAELNLKVGGVLFRAEATEERMEDAIERAKEDLKRELRRANNKRQSLMRRGARRVKEWFRFSK